MQVSIIADNRYHSLIINTLINSKQYKLNAETTDKDTITVIHDDLYTNKNYVFNHIRNLFWDYTGYRYPMQFVK